jgi:hypothetical protein
MKKTIVLALFAAMVGTGASARGRREVWTVVTTTPDQPDADLMYVIDENAMTWTEYAQGGSFGKLGPVGSGKLLLGDPVGGCAVSTARLRAC